MVSFGCLKAIKALTTPPNKKKPLKQLKFITGNICYIYIFIYPMHIKVNWNLSSKITEACSPHRGAGRMNRSRWDEGFDEKTCENFGCCKKTGHVAVWGGGGGGHEKWFRPFFLGSLGHWGGHEKWWYRPFFFGGRGGRGMDQLVDANVGHGGHFGTVIFLSSWGLVFFGTTPHPGCQSPPGLLHF